MTETSETGTLAFGAGGEDAGYGPPRSRPALAPWLTEDRRGGSRRRTCLGCGAAQDFPARGPRPSYVAWYRAHLACRPGKPLCSKSAPPAMEVHTPAVHTREALLDRTPANPGHKSHRQTRTVGADVLEALGQTYSGDKIMAHRAGGRSTIRKPATVDGQLYVSTGHYGGRGAYAKVFAYRLIPRSEWAGEALSYADMNADCGYHGIEVHCGRAAYVMQGPEVTFLGEPA